MVNRVESFFSHSKLRSRKTSSATLNTNSGWPALCKSCRHLGPAEPLAAHHAVLTSCYSLLLSGTVFPLRNAPESVSPGQCSASQQTISLEISNLLRPFHCLDKPARHPFHRTNSLTGRWCLATISIEVSPSLVCSIPLPWSAMDIRLWVSGREQLRTSSPRYTSATERRLPQSPELVHLMEQRNTSAPLYRSRGCMVDSNTGRRYKLGGFRPFELRGDAIQGNSLSTFHHGRIQGRSEECAVSGLG